MNRYIILVFFLLQSIQANKIENNLNLGKTNSSKKVLTINNNSSIFDMKDENIKKKVTQVETVIKDKANDENKSNQKKLNKNNVKSLNDNLDSFILRIYNAEIKTNNKNQKSAKNISSKKSFYVLENQNNSKNQKTKNNSLSNNGDLFLSTGYCQFENDVDITYETIRNIACKLDNKNLKEPELELRLIPKGELLIAEAISLTYKTKGKVISVDLDSKKSRILNKAGTSEQIATYINNRKIDKNINIAKKEISRNTNVALQSSYEQYKASRRKQNTQTDANGNVIVTSENQKPDIVTDVAYGLGNAALTTIDKITNISQEDLPYIYKIVKLSEIKVKFYKTRGKE